MLSASASRRDEEGPATKAALKAVKRSFGPLGFDGLLDDRGFLVAAGDGGGGLTKRVTNGRAAARAPAATSNGMKRFRPFW